MSTEQPSPPPPPPGPSALTLPVIRPIPARTLVAGLSVVILLSALFSYFVEVPRREYMTGHLEPLGGEIRILALKSGTVSALPATGTDVNRGDVVAVVDGTNALEPAQRPGAGPRDEVTSKELRAPVDATVLANAVSNGSTVLAGQLVSVLAVRNAPMQAVLHVPSRALAHLEVGQVVQLRMVAYPYETYGPIQAVIEKLEMAPVAPGDVPASARAAERDTFYKATARLLLVPDQTIDGTQVKLQSGMRFDASVEVERRTLLAWVVWPLLKQFN